MRADEKQTKNDHEMARIYNNIDEHCSDAECSDLYHQRTRCSAFVRAPETSKLGARA